jgi:hypothetical protein
MFPKQVIVINHPHFLYIVTKAHLGVIMAYSGARGAEFEVIYCTVRTLT